MLVKKVLASRFLDHSIPTVGCCSKDVNAPGLPMAWRALLRKTINGMGCSPGMELDKITACERMGLSRYPLEAETVRTLAPSISEDVLERLGPSSNSASR